jgi:hypothetical protein
VKPGASEEGTLSIRLARHLSALIFLGVVVFTWGRIVEAGCPNPSLTWEVNVSGPASECIDAVEEMVPDDCPELCEICQRGWDEDADLSEGEDYELEFEGCLEDQGPPWQSHSGWVKCRCGLQIG